MTTISREKKLSREALVFNIVAMLAITITLICVFAQIATAAAPLWHGGGRRAAWIDTGAQILLAAPALFYAYGLFRARQVFRGIGAGRLFAPEASQGLRAVGISLLIGAIWAMAVAGLDPSAGAPIREQLGQVAYAARDVALAALGLALIMVARVMGAAARLKAENDSFL